MGGGGDNIIDAVMSSVRVTMPSCNNSRDAASLDAIFFVFRKYFFLEKKAGYLSLDRKNLKSTSQNLVVTIALHPERDTPPSSVLLIYQHRITPISVLKQLRAGYEKFVLGRFFFLGEPFFSFGRTLFFFIPSCTLDISFGRTLFFCISSCTLDMKNLNRIGTFMSSVLATSV